MEGIIKAKEKGIGFGRKQQAKPVPYLGGIGIFLSVCITVLVSIAFSSKGLLEINLAMTILVPGGIIVVIGYLDDKKNLVDGNDTIH